MKFSFEVTPGEIKRKPEKYIDAVVSCLTSEFLIMPRGQGFVTFPVFEAGYEVLKQGTCGFVAMNAETIYDIVAKCPISFVVLRAMLGLTPPEWAYLATQATKTDISQGFIRALDRNIRSHPVKPLRASKDSENRIRKLAETACTLLKDGVPDIPVDRPST